MIFIGRPVDPNAQYRVKPHTTHGYTYASTQPAYIDEKTGKKKYRYIHWGRVDENKKFFPGHNFYFASPEERNQLIFPEDWDISEAREVEEQTDLIKLGRSPCDTDCQNRLYGDVWLLEQVAQKTGIRQDLEVVFHGNREIVDDILTLAMFLYLTKFTYNRTSKWQEVTKTPSSRTLTPTVITRLTQSVTEHHRMSLLRLRATRFEKDELCAVESTSQTAYRNNLADVRWGRNKDHLLLQQTTEVVVYTLFSHIPVYYQTFAGNMPDSRTLEVIFTDLDHAGFKDLVFITDRGFDTLQNLEKYILRGQAMIMCTKTGQRDVAQAIREIGNFGTRSDGMMVDSTAKIYHKQYDSDHSIENLKMNLYFDPIHRSAELIELDIAMAFQKETLEELVKKKSTVDIATVKRECCYYNITYDPEIQIILSFEQNEKKIEKASQFSGFFSVMTHGLDFDPMKTFRTYLLRDEQEKFFQHMKDQMIADRQESWLKDGKTGGLFISFVSLTLSLYVSHVWKSTELHDRFSSPLEMLDEMRSIRCVEHANRVKKMTPFVQAQVDICNAFEVEVPKGCSPTYVSRQEQKPRKGRPPKKHVDWDL